MRRLLSILLVSLLVFSSCQPAFAAATELDYMEYSSDANAQAAYVTNASIGEATDQSNTTINDGTALGNFNSNELRVGQSFILSGAKTVTAVEVRRDSVGNELGSPTGNWTLRIETDSFGVPSGTLADANASIVVTPPANNTIIKGTFATPFALNASQTYWLVVQCDNQSTNNYWSVSVNYDSSVYANGIFARKTNANWGVPWSGDMYFKVYVQGEKYLQSYSESTIKTQGSYALKAVAAITDSSGKTLTYTIDPPKDLSNKSVWKFDERASRTGANIKVGLHDSGGTTTEVTPNIITEDTYQTVITDISQVTNANKDAIDKIIITLTNADAANTVYLDNMFGDTSGQLILVE